MNICPNCGNQLEEESRFCNKCGTNLLDGNVPANKKPRKSKLKKSMLILTTLILIVGLTGGFLIYKDHQHKVALNNYKENLDKAATQIVAYSLASEKVCDLYSDVWKRAIDADYWIEVDGKKAYDFNEAIQYQREALESKNVLSEIEKGTKSVDDLMSKLKNPPTEFQASYEKLVELYGLYTQYADQADSPSGSLIEFNKKTDELSSEIGKEYNQLKTIIPEIKDSSFKNYFTQFNI